MVVLTFTQPQEFTDDMGVASAWIQAGGTVAAAAIATAGAAWIADRYRGRRESLNLQRQFVSEMNSASARFLVISRKYSRETRDRPDDRKAELRLELDQTFAQSTVSAALIAAKLRAYYPEEEEGDNARSLWHTVRDLITLRYLALIDNLDDETLKINSSDESPPSNDKEIYRHSRRTYAQLHVLNEPDNPDRIAFLRELGTDIESFTAQAAADVLAHRPSGHRRPT